MRLFVLLAVYLGALGIAQAHTNCEIYKVDSGTRIAKTIYTLAIDANDDSDQSKLVYIKTDGSITELTYGQVKNKTDFSDLNLSKFFTFRVESTNYIQIGYGDVDVSRKDVRRLISQAGAADTILLDAWADDLGAWCKLEK